MKEIIAFSKPFLLFVMISVCSVVFADDGPGAPIDCKTCDGTAIPCSSKQSPNCGTQTVCQTGGARCSVCYCGVPAGSPAGTNCNCMQ
jgi:hypothetical protein